jgi:hypothetical protein
MMPDAELHVHRLRLAVPHGDAAGHAARIEDALRVSSRPTELLHRHVLVRQLRLRPRADAGTQALALLLERAWLRIASVAVPLESARPDDEAVWAESVATARIALVQRWLHGDDADAWYWQRIAAVAGDGSWPDRVAYLALAPLVGAASRVHGGTAIPVGATVPLLQGIATALMSHGALTTFVDTIDDTSVQRLLALSEPASGSAPPHGERSRATGTAPTSEGRTEPARDRLYRALAAMSAVPIHPPRRNGRRHGAGARTGVSPTAMAGARGSRAYAAEAAADAGHHISGAARSSLVMSQTVVASHPQGTVPDASGWAGLWLLLPLCLRLGLADADDPLSAWSATMWAGCARFRIPAADPVRATVSVLGLPVDPRDARLDEPWLRKAREAAVRDARLPLLRIARRRGVAWISNERIDVELPVDAIDVRIRRAGFDVDPGFVPWLGRIVRFHYTT